MATDYSTINSTIIQPNPALTIPPVPQPDTSHIGVTQGIADTIAGDLTSLTTKTSEAQKQVDASGSGITDIMSQLTGKTADTQIANEAAGVNTATADVNKYQTSLADLNSQASQLNREAQAIPIQVQNQAVGTGATDRGIAPITSARLRDNALKALSIGQQADIASAALTGSNIRLQAAKDKSIQMVDLKYKPMEEKLAIKERQYALNKDALAAIDKKRAEALGVALEKEQQAINEKKANEKAISDMIINASTANAPSASIEAAKKAKTPAQAAMILKQYAGDYYKTELLKEQVKSERAQQAKLYADIDKIKADAGKTRAETVGMNQLPGDTFLDPKVIDNPTFKLAQSLTPVKTAIQAYKDAINTYGAYELADPTGRGAIQSSYGNAIAAWKTMAGLGALSGADFVLAENAIPEPAIFSRNSTSISKLDNSLANADSQISTYVKTLKTAYPKSVGGIDATINASQASPKVEVPNKFRSAIGGSSTPIMGTKIINKVGSDGSIEFTIPK